MCYTNGTDKYGTAPNGVPKPPGHHVSLFAHPMVPSVVSIKSPLRPNKAVLFVMAKAFLILQIYSVLCNLQGVYLKILDSKQNENLCLHIYQEFRKEIVVLFWEWEDLVKKMADFGNHRTLTLRCL